MVFKCWREAWLESFTKRLEGGGRSKPVLVVMYINGICVKLLVRMGAALMIQCYMFMFNLFNFGSQAYLILPVQTKFFKQSHLIPETDILHWYLRNITIEPSGAVCGAVGREGCTVGTSYCRNPTATALIQPAIKRSAEVNLFPLRSAQYTIDLGGSTGRQTYALISNSLHLIGTW